MSTNAVFRLSPGGQGVWQYDGSGTSWTQVGGPAGQIYGGGYGLVATNPSNGNLYRYLGTPNKWQQIGGPGAAFTVAGNTVFGLSPNRQGVWQYDGSGTSWTQVGGPAGQIYGGGYGLVATNPSNGDLWRYLGTPNKWQQIGGPGAAFTVAGNTVFGLSPGGQGVWQYDGSGTSWTQVGGPASEIVACLIVPVETSITLNGSPNVSGLNGHVTLTIEESGAYSFSGSWSPSNVLTGVISQDVNFVMTLRDVQGTVWVFSTSGTVPSESTYSFNNKGTNPSLAANWQFLQLGYTAHDQVNAGLDLGATWTAIENWYKQNEQTINEVVQVVGAIAGAVAS